jgi:hypothetical protein
MWSCVSIIGVSFRFSLLKIVLPNDFYQQALYISRAKTGFEIEKDVLAPPKGLEPLTDWLTASRSTWLSYGGTSKRYPLEFQKSI